MAEVKRKFNSPVPPIGIEVRKGRIILTASERPMCEIWACVFLMPANLALIWVHDISLQQADYKRELERYAGVLTRNGYTVEWVDTSLDRLERMAGNVQWMNKFQMCDVNRRLDIERMRTGVVQAALDEERAT
jgi:hypothetical protein